MTVFEARWRRVQEAAAGQGLQTVVIYSSGDRPSFIQFDPVWYLSGIRVRGDAFVVLPVTGEPSLMLTPTADDERARRLGSIEAVYTFDHADDLVVALRDRMGASATDGVAVAGMHNMDASMHRRLEQRLGVAPRSADDLLRGVASAKDAHEIALIRTATEIAEAGYDDALRAARPGMREFELAALLDVQMRSRGADDNFLLFSASHHNYGVHAPTDRILCEGDIILAEISPSYRGAFSQICRTIVIGEPDPLLTEKYALLQDAFWAGVEACKPGAPVTQAVAAINGRIADAGYEAYCRPPYMRTRGHGMGLGVPNPADLSPDSTLTFEPNGVMVLHPNQYIPEVGYLLCGDPVLITDDGCEVLVARPATLDVVR